MRSRADRTPSPLAGEGTRRVLIALYTLFALAAGARSAVQLTTRAEQAPLAYTLSAVAALTYLAATVLLRASDPGARRAARAVCMIELIGVLLVGSATVLHPAAFPDDTVWGYYGNGYGFLPLLLPIAALIWLARTRRHAATPCLSPDSERARPPR